MDELKSLVNEWDNEQFESCAEINHAEDAEERDAKELTRRIWSGLVGDVNVNSTSIANGLSQQLIYQMNLIKRDTLVSCEDLNIKCGSAAYPLVQSKAKEGLAKAIRDRGATLVLNSGYRTIVQQQILYNNRHKNSNPVAPPGKSRHQSGVAIDVEGARGWDQYMIRNGWRPLAGDPPHFDFSHPQDISHISVLAFQQLWNKNNPNDLIAEDGAYAVGGETEARLNKSPVMGFKVAPWAAKPRTLKLRTPYSAGHDVRQLQEKLLAAGCNTDVDGIFGPGTEKAVKAFQEKKGLAIDGIVKVKTLAMLGLAEPQESNISGADEVSETAPSGNESDSAIDTDANAPVSIADDQIVLKQGMISVQVLKLQKKLKTLNLLGGKADGNFGPRTKEALIAFQKNANLEPDGSAGPQTFNALGLSPERIKLSLDTMLFSVERVSKIFPDAPKGNLEKYLPPVLSALKKLDLGDRDMILMTLATIRAETAGFEPISEYQSKYNTESGGRPFALYDFRSDLGNNTEGDGAKFKGRGFVQLTGRNNYAHFGQVVGLGTRLLEEPELANDPDIAAGVLAHFLKSKEGKIRVALHLADLVTARKAVNGGTHGMDRFQEAFTKGQALISGITSDASVSSPGRVLKLQTPPMTGELVRKVQSALVISGASIEVNGTFDEATEQAVKVFQQKEGLQDDGVAGPNTLAKLQQVVQQFSLGG